MKKAFCSIAVIVTLAIIVGCAGLDPATTPETPQEVYLKARMTFNGLLADYVTQKRAATVENKAKWTENIDPLFEAGAQALNAWGTALDAEANTYSQQKAYLEIKNQLLALLMAELTKEQ
jgi:hypothetical protein